MSPHNMYPIEADYADNSYKIKIPIFVPGYHGNFEHMAMYGDSNSICRMFAQLTTLSVTPLCSVVTSYGIHTMIDTERFRSSVLDDKIAVFDLHIWFSDETDITEFCRFLNSMDSLRTKVIKHYNTRVRLSEAVMLSKTNPSRLHNNVLDIIVYPWLLFYGK